MSEGSTRHDRLSPAAKKAVDRYKRMAQAAIAVSEARKGRLDLLVERLRGPVQLSRLERDCLADFLEEKWKRPANNPGQRPDRAKQRSVYKSYWTARQAGESEKEAAYVAAEKHGITPSIVRHMCRAEDLIRKKQADSWATTREGLIRAGAGIVSRKVPTS